MSTLNGRVRKFRLRKKFNKYEVRRALLYVMEKQAADKAPGEKNGDLHNEFYNTGRIGRRNALPDILGYNCTTTTADLPERLSTLTTNDTQTGGTTTTTASGAAGTTSKVYDRNEPSTSQSCNMNNQENCSSQRTDEDMNTT